MLLLTLRWPSTIIILRFKKIIRRPIVREIRNQGAIELNGVLVKIHRAIVSPVLLHSLLGQINGNRLEVVEELDVASLLVLVLVRPVVPCQRRQHILLILVDFLCIRNSLIVEQ